MALLSFALTGPDAASWQAKTKSLGDELEAGEGCKASSYAHNRGRGALIKIWAFS